MTLYKVQSGESPAFIARKLRTSVSALIAANPHKPTTVVGGKRTWQSLHRNEQLRAPSGSLGDPGTLGAIAPAAANAAHGQIKQGSSGPDVALWQMIIGVPADGVFGPQTAAATRTWQGAHGLSADGVVGPKSWTAALQGAIPASAPPPPSAAAPAPIPAASSGGQPTIRQGSTGTAVKQWQAIVGVAADGVFGSQTAAATKTWQAAHGLTADGIVGPKTWAVAAMPGSASASPAAAAAIPVSFDIPTSITDFTLPALPVAPVAPPPASFSVPGIAPLPAPVQVQMPAISSIAVPPAVAALVGVDLCNPANAQLVCMAQLALGFKPGAGVDGKWGADAAAAARKYLPNAPAACSPRPTWWAPKGQSNCSGALAIPVSPSSPTASIPQPAQPSQSLPAGGGVPSAGQPIIVAPEEKKEISTGAMIAGAVGLAALVGIVAVAASGKKSTSRTTTSTTTRRAPARKSAHKPTKHKKRK